MDTLSDLLLGMAAEPDFAAAYLADVIGEREAETVEAASEAERYSAIDPSRDVPFSVEPFPPL
jgi:hypothetical protein